MTSLIPARSDTARHIPGRLVPPHVLCLVVSAVSFLRPLGVAAQDPLLGEADVMADVFFAVTVRDLEASSNWYERIFGLDVVRNVSSRDGRGRARMLMGGRVIVEIISYEGARDPQTLLGPEAHPFSLVGIAKVGLFVRDADRLHEQLRAIGVILDASVAYDDVLGAETFVFRDPDGNRIQVFERREAQPDSSSELSGRLGTSFHIDACGCGGSVNPIPRVAGA